MVVDGQGEDCATSLGYAKNSRIKLFQKNPITDSLGYFYESISKFIGFSHLDAGKVMGLAAYGDPEAYQFKNIKLTPSGYEIKFSKKVSLYGRNIDEQLTLQNLWYQYLKKEFSLFPNVAKYSTKNYKLVKELLLSNISSDYVNLAAAAQNTLERVILHLSKVLQRKTHCDNLVIRQPLPKNDFRNYDMVFFDPPYTPQAINAWLVRAMESTLGGGRNKKRKKPEALSTKLYFMCYGYTDMGAERGLKIQKIITSLGLIISDKLRCFNNYHGAEVLRSLSDLYIMQPTPKVNIRQLDVARSQFYTDKKQAKK